jgi:glycosyltransferase involved in cell wall biosynthesis
MRVTLISMTTFSHRSYRSFLHEVARRVSALTVLTGDLPTAHSTVAAPRDEGCAYDLHLVRTRLAASRATTVFSGLRGLVRETKPDVVHVIAEPWQLLAFQGARAARVAGAPASIHFAENGPRMIGAGGLVRRTLGTAFLGKYDRAVGMTSQSNSVARALTKRIEVVTIPPPSGVGEAVATADGRAWFSDAADGRFRIAFVGRLVAEKGPDDFMRACDALTADVPLNAVVAGEGPYLAPVSDWSQRHGYAALGRLGHDDVLELLAQADLLVIPSRTVPGLAEQFGRVAVEAMSRGTPVVGYDCGGLVEVVGDAGRLVPEGDERALREAIRAVALASDADRLALRARAQARADTFSDAAIAESHVALWESMLADATSGAG